MNDSLSEHVRAWRRLPLFFAMPATLLALFLLSADAFGANPRETSTNSLVETTAVVVRPGPGGTVVGRWFDPTRKRFVEGWLTSGAGVGDEIAVMADTRDPASTRAVGDDRQTAWWRNMPWYAVLTVPTWFWWISRHLTVRRTVQTLGVRPVSYRMVAVMGRAPGRRRPVVLLYPLDARVGERPVAGVPLLPGVPRRLGDRVDVEVYGLPGPGSFVVPVAVGDDEREGVLWPAGRSVMRATAPWSENPADWKAGHPSLWPVVVAALVGTIAILGILGEEVSAYRRFNDLRRNGDEVTATVTGIDDLTYRVLYPATHQHQDILRTADIYFDSWSADTLPVKEGDRRRILVDRRDPVAVDPEGAYTFTGTIVFGIGAVVLIAATAAICAYRRPLVEDGPYRPRSTQKALGRPSDGPSGTLVATSEKAPLPRRSGRRFGLAVRFVDGSLVIGGARRVLPKRWEIRLRPDGLELSNGRGEQRRLGWDDDWVIASRFLEESSSSLLTAGCLQIHLPRGNRIPEALTLSGTHGFPPLSPDYWATPGPAESAALIHYLRTHPDSRAALGDPQRCHELVSALMRLGTTSYFSFVEAGPERLIVDRIGGALCNRPLTRPQPANRPTADELTEFVMTHMNVYDRDRIRARRVRRRVEFWLRTEPWPFWVLDGPTDRFD